ncbi:MAG TPA: primosomal protein N' [Clostridiales bacterium]|nr:MAG: primosomal protein N' [Clostridiales bacterium GWD2_32_19]HCC07186.1 primosomal protein N' [Clostridiales bacterium]
MYVNILINRSNSKLNKTFSYKVPTELECKVEIGKRVLVPFGAKNKPENGYILEKLEHVNIDYQIKEIIEVIDDFPLFDLKTLKLADFIKEKYMCNMVDAINIIMPGGIKNVTAESNTDKYLGIKVSEDEIDSFIIKNESKEKYKAQIQVLSYLKENSVVKLSDLKNDLKITDSPIKTLIKNELIEVSRQDKKLDIYKVLKNNTVDFVLNNEQRVAVEKIKEKIEAKVFSEMLIFGVTSSGKTEVYIEAIKEVIKQGRQGIVLVPEIALTPQIVRRFKQHFGDGVVVMHSKLSDTEKYNQWNRIKKREVSVMVGPRSAVFAPFDDVGIVVIDEEHDSAYKSENTPKYDAKEVARFICENNNAVLLYGSATPKIETYYRAQNGEIELIRLNKRVNEADNPTIHIVDMKEELKNGNTTIISHEVHKQIQDKLNKGEQILIFINRRGFSTFVSCRKCGYVMKCYNCDMPYVYHYDTDTLACHHCGKSIRNVNMCPECNSKYIKFFGLGTEKVEDDIQGLFKNARILRMDADTTSKKNSHDAILTDFNEGRADILIGTQMIAKGHDFRNVTMVVILAADMSLNIQDFRAYERSFQLFTQLAGRAGRSGKDSAVYIQTYEEKNYVLECIKNYDYEKFYKNEIMLREQLENPPFSNICIITLIGENEKKIIIYINGLKKYLEYYNIKGNYKILGPAPNFIKKINDNYRWRLVIKGTDEEKVKNFVKYSINKFNEKEKVKDVKIQIDIN